VAAGKEVVQFEAGGEEEDERRRDRQDAVLKSEREVKAAGQLRAEEAVVAGGGGVHGGLVRPFFLSRLRSCGQYRGLLDGQSRSGWRRDVQSATRRWRVFKSLYARGAADRA